MLSAATELDVAIIGMGPRGLSVLERLLIRIAELEVPTPIRIWVFDPGEHGAGRIWRTDQPDWFMMNTVAGEVSMYSGGPDAGPTRAGFGPSLHEWLARHDDPRWSCLGENDFAPRFVYGQYLIDVFDSIVARRSQNVTIHPVTAMVDRIERSGGKTRVLFGERCIDVDKAVFTTGHPSTTAGRVEQRLLDFASAASAVRYLRGDSAADLDLTSIACGEAIGVIGLGLTFLDVVMALTIGRGGVFEPDSAGNLRYLPSGQEPQIVAGSRTGLPMLARGLNQKRPKYRYQPKFITAAALAKARARALHDRKSPQLDFRHDVLPLLALEVEHTYYTTLVRSRAGDAAAECFARRHLLSAAPSSDADTELLNDFGIADAAPISLERLARPFAGMSFRDPTDFQRRVLDLLRADLAAAQLGNVHGPLKAALDTLRDVRSSVRAAIDFGGLSPDSHRDEFLGWFNPINTMLSAGPPAVRVAQICALIESGVVGLVGPALQIECADDQTGFVLSSGQVGFSARVVTTLIDARIPRPSIRTDSSPLTRQLIADGVISEYVNLDPVTGGSFSTGAVAVTASPFHVVGSDGRPDLSLYMLGIPTENQRWFTQIGNGRPGPLSGFHADADAVAQDVLSGVPTPASPAHTTTQDHELVVVGGSPA